MNKTNIYHGSNVAVPNPKNCILHRGGIKNIKI